MKQLSEGFLTKALSLLWRSPEHADRYLSLIPEGTFEEYEILERVYAGLKVHREKYGHPTDIAAFAEYLLGEIPNFPAIKDKERGEFLDALAEIHDAAVDVAPAFIEDRLEVEVIRAQSSRIILDAFETAQGGEFTGDDLRGLINDLQTVERVRLASDTGSSIVEGLEARQKRRLRELRRVARIPTGIEKIDETMNGGVKLKKLAFIMGRLGRGKTAFLVHLAKIAFLNGFPVLFVTLELAREDIEDRFDAALTRTPVLQLYEQYEIVKSRFAKWHRSFDEDIRIIEGVAYQFDVAALDAKIEECHRNKFFPKMVIVDYADLMLPEKKGYKDRRFELENIYVTLRRMAVVNKLLVWTASQANRQGEGKLITTVHASEADAKSQAADLVLSINQNFDQKEAGMVDLFVAKSRLGRDQFLVDGIEQDLVTMNFIADAPDFGAQFTPYRALKLGKKKHKK